MKDGLLRDNPANEPVRSREPVKADDDYMTSGMTIKETMRRIGHSSMVMAMRYQRALDGRED